VATKATDAVSQWRHPAIAGGGLGASAGVALATASTPVEEALRVADMRMFEAKRARPPTVRYATAVGTQDKLP